MIRSYVIGGILVLSDNLCAQLPKPDRVCAVLQPFSRSHFRVRHPIVSIVKYLHHSAPIVTDCLSLTVETKDTI